MRTEVKQPKRFKYTRMQMYYMLLFRCFCDLTYRLVVELTLVLLRERRDIIESPQLTTVPLLIENVRSRYKSSLCRGL